MTSKVWRALWADESAATAIEYGLIAACIAIVIIAAITMVGTAVNDKFTMVANSMSAAGS